MHLGPDDIRRAHEFFGDPAALVAQRRAVYAVAAQLLTHNESTEPPAEVLDNPLVRGHLGEVLSGASAFSEARLRPVTDLVASGYSMGFRDGVVRLASSDIVNGALRGPLALIATEIGRHGDDSWEPVLVTAADARTPDVWAILVEGVQLALRVTPELTSDLLPHISLFAIVRSAGFDRLGSASAREYPGLIVLPEPSCPLEVAEALMHEGAHQKFFDVAMSRAILVAPAGDEPRFRPSWATSEAPDWPLQQAFAAFHAYTCLGAFFDAVQAHLHAGLAVHAHSLLPYSQERAAEIGGWLLDESACLGWQGRPLLDLLLGRQPTEAGPAAPGWTNEPSMATADVTRRFGSQTLVACRADPVELYWLDVQAG